MLNSHAFSRYDLWLRYLHLKKCKNQISTLDDQKVRHFQRVWSTQGCHRDSANKAALSKVGSLPSSPMNLVTDRRFGWFKKNISTLSIPKHCSHWGQHIIGWLDWLIDWWMDGLIRWYIHHSSIHCLTAWWNEWLTKYRSKSSRSSSSNCSSRWGIMKLYLMFMQQIKGWFANVKP